MWDQNLPVSIDHLSASRELYVRIQWKWQDATVGWFYIPVHLSMLVNETYPACYLFHDAPNLLIAKRADETRVKRWSRPSYGWRCPNRLAVYVVFQVPVAQFHVDGVEVVRTRRHVPMVKNMDNIWVCLSFAKPCDSSSFSLDFFLGNVRVKYFPCENLSNKLTREKVQTCPVETRYIYTRVRNWGEGHTSCT
jgi:hypothetical protein